MKFYLNKKILSKTEYSIIITLFALIVMLLGGFTVLSMGFLGSICDGKSMDNTIGDNYKMLSVSTKIKKIERGDIVSIKLYSKGKPLYIIKRVIGLPGETINIQGNTVSINGNMLVEAYAYYESLSFDDIEYMIKDNEYYVLGDNRLHSGDSREIGAIPKENIVRNVIFYRK